MKRSDIVRVILRKPVLSDKIGFFPASESTFISIARKLSASSSASVSLILSLLLLGCGADDLQQPLNQDPVILQMVPPTVTVVGQRVAFQVEASDPDGDTLIYDWQITDGLLSANGPEALWLAPDTPGTYALTITVQDGNGGFVQKSIDLTVKASAPVSEGLPLPPPDSTNFAAPIIQSIWAAPVVLPSDQTSEITVEATDPAFGEMQYTWQATGGQLLVTAPNRVTWTPPEQPGRYTVIATVTNGLNEQSAASIQLHVVARIPGNRPPSILSLEALPGTSVRGGRDTASFTVRAFDPDGDKLSHFWNHPRGTLEGEGVELQWTAPTPLAPCCAIPYAVTVAVTVSDGKGGSDMANIQMTVVP